jgi:hypothetical protein
MNTCARAWWTISLLGLLGTGSAVAAQPSSFIIASLSAVGKRCAFQMQPRQCCRGTSGDSPTARFILSGAAAARHMAWAADGSMCALTSEVRRCVVLSIAEA